ncbi:hypothetical protein TrVE_jg13092 [Triparma verrucosa]|uniref:Uncharacterized protein n=1 Tax=Triparma verrucosa TaxID=1606542 RepID=A0A9W7BE93_9STRA|nr:hypothetical protein TrVE_jg13092 [Triparma verrucosa]
MAATEGAFADALNALGDLYNDKINGRHAGMISDLRNIQKEDDLPYEFVFAALLKSVSFLPTYIVPSVHDN